MIHTGHLLIYLEENHVKYKQNIYGRNKTFNKIMEENKMLGIKARQYYAKENRMPRCSIIFDVTQILQTGVIIESDYYRIKSYIKCALGIVYGDEDLYNNHNLVRIDYRYDIKVHEAAKRHIYLYLYNKTRGKYRRLTKKGLESYRTSIYHECKSMETVLYSKNEECTAKNRLPEVWEKDVMRFEVRLKNSHLYHQAKKTGESKCLSNFFKRVKFEKYMQDYLMKIYPTGDFYDFNTALNLIEKSDYSPTIKIGLKTFLRNVSNGTLDTPKKTTYTKAISEDTWRERIKKFNESSVNPITIPVSKKIQHLPNLLKDIMEEH